MTVTVGDQLTEWRFEVTADAIETVARVLRDPNPIHLDPAAVRAAGLGERCINQGPANLAYAVNMLARALPDARLAVIESRYLANVLCGDTAVSGGTVVSIEGDRIVCDFWVRNGEGAVAVAGRATLQMGHNV